VRSTASETVEANDNQFLRTLPAWTISSYSTLAATAEARTTTSKFDFDSNVNFRKYWGPGAEGLPQTENLSYSFRGAYETYGKNGFDRNFVESSFSQQSSAFSLLNELGLLTPVKGAVDRLTFRGGIDRALNAQDSISLSGQSTRTFYEPSSAGTAFTDTVATGLWRHRVSAIAALNVSSSAEWLSYENALGTNTLILRNQGGIDLEMSPLLSFRGNFGAANVITENGINPLATNAIGSSNRALSSSSIGFITDVLVTYKAMKSTTFTLAATQSIGPTITGSLFKTSSVRAGMNYIINSRSSVSLGADVNRSTSTNTTEFASASISYSYQLAREWTAQLSYRHLHRFASTGTASVDPTTGTPILSGSGPVDSNSFVVVVSKSTTILPHSD